MSTRKRGILQRLTRSGAKTKKENKVNVNVQPTTEVEPTSPYDQNQTKGLHDSPLNRTFSNISDFPQSSISSVSDSNETMASDLMKCLNNLRIQAVSVTNSTPSVSSIPRLAPPPNQKSAPSGCDKIDTPLPQLRSQFSQRSDSARVSMSESKDEDLQITPSTSWIEFNPQMKTEFDKNKSTEEEDVNEGEIMFRSLPMESNLDDVFGKFGSPMLELMERVDVCFSGTEISNYSISGEMKFKLSNSRNHSSELTTTIDFLKDFDFSLTMLCILQSASLKNIMVKKSLRESTENHQVQAQESDLECKHPSMTNKAKDGILESRNLQLNLSRCYQEALHNPITLLKYSAEPSAFHGPPLNVQIHWIKPEASKFRVLIDVVLVPNRKLGMSLWGVNICLKGFQKFDDDNNNHFKMKEALTSPQAKWNPSECGFEWYIPVIHPMDSATRLRVRLSEDIGMISERALTASIKFVIPHVALSGTSVIGRILPKPQNEFEAIADEVDSTLNKKNEKSGSSFSDSHSIFCQKVCLSGDYKATIKY